MIIVIAPFKSKSGMRNKILSLVEPCIEATRKEPGCYMYELMISTEDENVFSFVEKWKDKESLRQHLASYHVKKFFGERAQYLEVEGDVNLFEATQESL
jgi:quinol monooxygenase YgiN